MARTAAYGFQTRLVVIFAAALIRYALVRAAYGFEHTTSSLRPENIATGYSQDTSTPEYLHIEYAIHISRLVCFNSRSSATTLAMSVP